MSMYSKRNQALNGLVKEDFFDVESVARLFDINNAIAKKYRNACAELAEPRVASMVRFLTDLDSLEKQHNVTGRENILLLDADYFKRKDNQG